MSVDQAQFDRVFGEAVARELEKQGRPADDPSSQSTIRTNTDLVPSRAQQLLEMMRALLDRSSLEGLRVLEVGSGFGALAAYLAAHEHPATFVAIDVREDYVRLASSCAEALGLGDALRLEVVDMRDLGAFADGAFDLVFANNAFLYVADKQDAARAMAEFARVLAPGGELMIFQANRWRFREPFTKSPLIHLLPVWLADLLARHTSLRHNHGRIRLSSPGGLARQLRRAGLRPTHPASFRNGLTTKWPQRSLGTFFGLGARKPAQT